MCKTDYGRGGGGGGGGGVKMFQKLITQYYVNDPLWQGKKIQGSLWQVL